MFAAAPLLFALGAGGLWAPEAAAAEADFDAVYEQVFGHAPPDLTQTIDAQLVIDDFAAGGIVLEVPVYGTGIRIDARGLLGSLEEVLLEDALGRVASGIDEDDRISTEYLAELGIDARYSERRSTLTLETPVSMRKVTIIDVRGGDPRGADQRLQPARTSAYLNSFTRMRAESDFAPLFQSFAGSLNHRGWVAQAVSEVFVDLEETRNRSAALRYVNAHRDDLERRLRYEGGSVPALSVGPSFDEELLGIGVASTSTLAFFERPQPEITHHFELREASNVKVRINQSVRSFELGPGRYELRDFPLVSGVNSIDIEATEYGEKLFSVRRGLIWEDDILSRGEHQISATAGVPLVRRDVTEVSDPENFLVAGYYRYGLTPSWSLGGSAKLNRERRDLMLGALHGARYGLLDLSAGLSHFDGRSVQGAGRLSFRNYSGFRWTNWLSSYGASLLGQSPRFDQRTKRQPESRRVASATTWLGFVLPWRGSSGYFRFFYDLNQRGAKDTVGTGLTLRQRPLRELELELRGDWRRDLRGEDQWFVSFHITHQPRSLSTRTRLNFRTPDDVFALEYNHRRAGFDDLTARFVYDNPDNLEARADLTEGNWDAGTNYHREDGSDGFGGRLGYSGPRGRFFGSYGYGPSPGVDPERNHLGEVWADTAVVYADGVVGWSEPVRNSFLVLRPNPRFESARMEFSRRAVADAFGPAVIANLQPLQTTTVRVMGAELPPGAWLPQRAHSLNPLPDTGYLVTVGAGGGLLVEGLLLDEFGAPVPLAGARVVSLDRPEAAPQLTFTDRDGAFTLIDVEPGRYRFEAAGRSDQRVEFVVPEDAPAIFGLGLLQLPPRDGAPDPEPSPLPSP